MNKTSSDLMIKTDWTQGIDEDSMAMISRHKKTYGMMTIDFKDLVFQGHIFYSQGKYTQTNNKQMHYLTQSDNVGIQNTAIYECNLVGKYLVIQNLYSFHDVKRRAII